MEYTLVQRKTLTSSFKKALRRLPPTIENDDGWDFKSPFICDNISYTSGYIAADLACDLISERIDKAFSIVQWLKNQSPEIADAVRDDVINNNGRKLQAYRKEWLRKLIAEFEA
jgi:hypothetical protein